MVIQKSTHTRTRKRGYRQSLKQPEFPPGHDGEIPEGGAGVRPGWSDSEVSREVVDESVLNHNTKDLICAMITLGIEDYLWMKQTHLIANGKVDTLAVRFASEKIGKTLSKYHVADTYAFFWDGWMERMIENTGIQIDPTLIYQKLEPELWKTLIHKQKN